MSEPSWRRDEAYTLASALTPKRCTGNLYEHFVVVGIREESVHNLEYQKTAILPPEILYTYPERQDDLIDPLVKNFAFPNNVPVKTYSSKWTSSDMLPILFQSPTILEQPDHSFIFVITTDTLLYGVCVYTDEVLSDHGVIIPPPSIEQPLDQSEPSEQYYLPESCPSPLLEVVDLPKFRLVSTRKCYLFLSRFPFFKLHFSVLYSLLDRDRLYRQSKLETGLNKHNHIENSTSVATQLIRQTLEAYRIQKISEMGAIIHFSIPGEIRTIQFLCPPSDDVSSLADWCIACLLRVLSLHHIITFFNALVLEHPIALISSNLGILSAVALSLIPLLRPLIWQGAFIPILPDHMHDILDAPFPLLVGLTHFPTTHGHFLHEFVIIYLDQNRIQVPMKKHKGTLTVTFQSSTLLPLPDWKKLEDSIKPLHQQLAFPPPSSSSHLPQPVQPIPTSTSTPHFKQNPLQTNTRELVMIKKVTRIFNNYLENLTCLIRDTIILHKLPFEDHHNLVIDKVPSLLPRHYRKFVIQFFQTQMFDFYSQQLLQKIHDKRLENVLFLDKIQNLLQMERDEYISIRARKHDKISTSLQDQIDKEMKQCMQRITQLELSKQELTEKDPKLTDELQRSNSLRKWEDSMKSSTIQVSTRSNTITHTDTKRIETFKTSAKSSN